MTIGEIAEAAAARLKRSLPVLAAEGEAVRGKRRAVHFAAEPWQVPPDAPLPGLIDYTLLEAKATATDIEQLCRVALTHSFRAVCVNPLWIDLAASVLRGSDVRVVSTVGFPLGAQRSLVKAVEAAEAVSRGAQEIDMVIPLGALLAGDLATVYEDIAAVVEAAGSAALVKVILETAVLNAEQKVMGSLLAMWAGADFVKTSTGFGAGGATTADVQLLRAVVGNKMGVKAAGGIRKPKEARAMIGAGASRIGTSRGPQLLEREDESETIS